MAREHVEADLQFKLVGHHEGIFTADIDWNENNVGQVEGTVDLKMLKPIRYDIRNGSVALRQDNGTIHVEAVLENGSATRDCSLDITPNDEVNAMESAEKHNFRESQRSRLIDRLFFFS